MKMDTKLIDHDKQLIAFVPCIVSLNECRMHTAHS